jgi:hypothetical protein
MQLITEDLYKKLNIGRFFKHEIRMDDIDSENNNPDYWIRKLRHTKWNLDKEVKNYMKLLFRCAKNIKIISNDALIFVCGSIKAKRSTSSITYTGKYKEDYHFNLNEMDFEINETNCEKWFKKLNLAKQIKTDSIEYDVTTLGKDEIPFCHECNGRGDILCRDCKGDGSSICYHCDGKGEIIYEAGNFANGTTRYNSKKCPICNGGGVLKCRTCQGTGSEICPSCNGIGKQHVGDCVQEIKSFTDAYSLIKEISLCVCHHNGTYKIIRSIKTTKHEDVELNWFSPFHITQLYRYNNLGNELVIDRSQEVVQAVCNHNKKYKKIVTDFLPLKQKTKNMVLFTENIFILKDFKQIIITHDLDGYDENDSLYFHNGHLWIEKLGFKTNSEKFQKTISHIIKSLFSKNNY